MTSDPLAPASGRFALRGSSVTERPADAPSPAGVRPWGLRRARPMSPGAPVPPWRYDEQRQLAVDTVTGVPLIVAGDPSAHTTAGTDGEDPPSSEDWIND